MYKLLAISGLLLLLTNCNTTQLSLGCPVDASVQEFAGLDGCGLMLVTDAGLKLLPAIIDPPGFNLEAGQRVRIGFVVEEDMGSVCMAEDQIVRITCIQLISGPEENE